MDLHRITGTLLALLLLGTPTSAKFNSSSEVTTISSAVPAMSLTFYKYIKTAHDLIDAGALDKAKALLHSVLQKDISDYERSTALQLFAFIYFEEQNIDKTIDTYKQILSLSPAIPDTLKLNILYALGQLYHAEEDHDEALQYLSAWENSVDPASISAGNLVLLAQLRYALQNYQEATQYIHRAIRLARESTSVDIQPHWYELALSAHWELKQYAEMRDVLEVLLINWPKPVYWTQLAAIYQQLGDKHMAYSLTEAAYKQGFLDGNELYLIQAAQIQLALNMPIKCTWVIEKGMRDGRISKSSKNLQTLGHCYLKAQEPEKALPALAQAANLEQNPEIWLQIGKIKMQLDIPEKAIPAFEKAITGFEAANDRANLFTAIMRKAQALIELKKYDEAQQIFINASAVSQSKNNWHALRQWRAYLAHEKQREAMLIGR